MRPGDVLLAVDARSYFPLAYESGRSSHPTTLPGPLWFWDDGSEPAFFGSGLIDASRSVVPRIAERGGRLTIPGLAPNGSIWIVPLTNDDYELGTFAPLARGEVVEVSRTVVRGGGYTTPVVRLRVAPAAP